MSESKNVLADFMATFTADGTWETDPVDGRVLLSPDQLVLVGPDTKRSFPLSRLVDVNLGRVPPEYSQYFNDSVVVAFESGGGRPPLAATIEADGGAVDQFGQLLFKTQLHEQPVLLNHPARVGGRVADGGFGPATLYLGDGAVTFGDIDTPFSVSLDAVTDFGRPQRTVDGSTRRVLSISYVQSGDSMTTEIDTQSSRRSNLLGRYLRIEYSKRLEDIREIDLSAAETELLVALHSGASTADLAGVLGVDTGQLSLMLNELEDAGLLSTEENGVHLTSTGRIALEEHLEDVNE